MFGIVFSLFRSKIKKNQAVKTEPQEKSMTLRQLIVESEKEISTNNLKKALTLLNNAIELDPTSDYAYGEKALIFDKLGKFEESVKMYSKAIELNQKNAITWHNMGLTLIKQKEIQRAIFCFDKSISINKEYAKAWYNKGRCLEMQKKLNDAQECLNMAKKLDPFLFSKIKL